MSTIVVEWLGLDEFYWSWRVTSWDEGWWERELITKHDMISADMSIADPKLRTFVLLLWLGTLLFWDTLYWQARAMQSLSKIRIWVKCLKKNIFVYFSWFSLVSCMLDRQWLTWYPAQTAPLWCIFTWLWHQNYPHHISPASQGHSSHCPHNKSSLSSDPLYSWVILVVISSVAIQVLI